jgi:hypothetical protein
MAMTAVDAARPVTGSVDTHLDVNVAAALDPLAGLLGVAEFPTTGAGHRQLTQLRSFLQVEEAAKSGNLRYRPKRSSANRVLPSKGNRTGAGQDSRRPMHKPGRPEQAAPP